MVGRGVARQQAARPRTIWGGSVGADGRFAVGSAGRGSRGELTKRSSAQGGGSYGGGALTQGGYQNLGTGAGGGLDKGEGGFFYPTRWYSRHIAEIVRVQSSAARKFIEMPIDDMFAGWRDWSGDDEGATEAMADVDERLMVAERVTDAIKAGRQQGTALLVMVTQESGGDLTEPLMPERIREGDLVELRIYDRHTASVWKYQTDALLADFNKPAEYYITPYRGGGFYVHPSRVIRFNGIDSLQSDGFNAYDQDWGVSILIPAITSILQDSSIAQGAAHLAQVASIPVVGVSGLREALQGAGAEVSAEQVAQQVNQAMSIYRLLMIDKESEDFNRVAVSFGGLNDLLERVERRLAAAHMPPIPFTKWQGESPGGLGSSGKGEERSYLMSLEAQRVRHTRKLRPLDEVLARAAGLREPPDVEWPSLIEVGDQEQAEASKMKADALAVAIESGAIDEDEMRRQLDGDPIFGSWRARRRACRSRSPW